MNRTLSPSYKPRVEAILQKTYNEHGVKARPWGISPKGHCSYRLGCAIGVSMSATVAESADNGGYGFIRELLLRGDATGMIAEELLGTRNVPPGNVAQVLTEMQNIHDNFASDDLSHLPPTLRGTSRDDDSEFPDSVYRAMYREELEKLAALWGLELTTFSYS